MDVIMLRDMSRARNSSRVTVVVVAVAAAITFTLASHPTNVKKMSE